MADRPFVRVYHADLIRDYPDVWDNDAALAAWVRLLVSADGSWPAPSEMPRSAKAKAVSILSTSGLVIPEGSHRYRIKGMDAERTQRADAARNAAAKRWHSGRNAEGNAETMPIRAEPSQAEPDRAEPSARESMNGDDGRADLETFTLITRKTPTPRQRALLDGLLDRHDLTGPKWAADIMMRHPDDPIGAVIEADKAWRAERIAEAQAAEKPKPVPRRPRGIPTHSRELLAHWEAEKRAEVEARKEPADAR